MAELIFDTNDNPPDNGGGGEFKPIEPGTYVVTVADMKVSGYGEGGEATEKVTATFQMDEESHPKLAKRKFWIDFLMWHKRGEKAAKTREIARGKFSALCVACGKASIKDTDDLLGSVLQVELYHGKEYNGKPQIQVGKYTKLEDSQPVGAETSEMDPPW